MDNFGNERKGDIYEFDQQLKSYVHRQYYFIGNKAYGITLKIFGSHNEYLNYITDPANYTNNKIMN